MLKIWDREQKRIKPTKQQKYCMKQQKRGRCWHCGKICIPYYQCDERSTYKKLLYTLKRLILAGKVEKIGGRYGACNKYPLIKMRCLSYNIKKTDPRKFPRINGKPVNYIEIIKEVLKKAGHPLTKDEIYKQTSQQIFADKRLKEVQKVLL